LKGWFLAAALMAAAPGALARGGIESAPLMQLDAWSVGGLSRSQGALGPDLWRRSEPALVAALYDRLPAAIVSPAAFALARRALLSPGLAPPGEGALEAARKRFSALGRLGFADELATMAAGAGASDPAIAQYAAQAELARSRRADACARGRQSGGEEPNAFLLRLRAFCAAAIGERAAADLALEIARSGGNDEAWYRSAIAGIGENAARPSVTARYDASLNTAISLAANLRAPANPLTNASALALLTLARSDAAAQPIRAQAAHLAYRRGAMSAAEARALLAAAPDGAGLPPLAAAIKRVDAQPGTLAAAAAIADALKASAPADFTAAARIFLPDIATLAQAPDAAGALTFARAAIASGDPVLGERLLASALAAGADAATTGRIAAALAVAKGSDDPAVARARLAATTERAAQAGARDLAILSAVGVALDPPVRAHIAAHPPQGGAAIDRSLLLGAQSAAAEGATGETALIAAAALAPGAQTLEAGDLAALLRAMRAAGLEADARAAAVEALLF
jgi:hypothetical protein